MRRGHGSRQAGIVSKASPPNSPFRYGRGVGPWRISAALSTAVPWVRYPLTETSRFVCVSELSVGACLYRLFILSADSAPAGLVKNRVHYYKSLEDTT